MSLNGKETTVKEMGESQGLGLDAPAQGAVGACSEPLDWRPVRPQKKMEQAKPNQARARILEVIYGFEC